MAKTDTVDKQHRKKKVNRSKIFREIEIRSLLIGFMIKKRKKPPASALLSAQACCTEEYRLLEISINLPVY